MCGILGYAGSSDILSVLVSGLERLSYRGYDSSGIAIISDDELCHWKSEGKTHLLVERHLKNLRIENFSVGIAHTRWATHGAPNDLNAHPQLSMNRKTAIVHNGIVENFAEIKSKLQLSTTFHSETDTEVIVQLIEHFASKEEFSFREALCLALKQIEGNCSFTVITEHDPKVIYAVKKGQPLIIGLGKNENFIASDMNAILPYTKRYLNIQDGEIAMVRQDGYEIIDFDGKPVARKSHVPSEISGTLEQANKGSYKHYMLKEIDEQPEVLARLLHAYAGDGKQLDFMPSLNSKSLNLAKLERFIIYACGTSWHAGLVAKYWIEEYVHVPAEVDISSEYRYRKGVSRRQDGVLALSQSGETADTLAGVQLSKEQGAAKVISFINRENSAMEKHSDGVIRSLAGMEIGVASTKNYLAQLLSLYLFTLHMARLKKTMSAKELARRLDELAVLPSLVRKFLLNKAAIQKIAKKYSSYKGFFFIGRGLSFPTALEGALKLKEIAYLYAVGYPAGELKHGPIALVDEKMPVVTIMPESDTYNKMMNNLEEVKARKGKIIAIATEGDERALAAADDCIFVPRVRSYLSPLVTVLPLQLLAYYTADILGRDVDQPKNLAKSVTVE